jgi:hypothetical protein
MIKKIKLMDKNKNKYQDPNLSQCTSNKNKCLRTTSPVTGSFMVPTKPAFTVTGSFSEFRASAFITSNP